MENNDSSPYVLYFGDQGSSPSQISCRWSLSWHWLLSFQDHGALTCLGNPANSTPQLAFRSGPLYCKLLRICPLEKHVPHAVLSSSPGSPVAGFYRITFNLSEIPNGWFERTEHYPTAVPCPWAHFFMFTSSFPLVSASQRVVQRVVHISESPGEFIKNADLQAPLLKIFH